MWMTKITVNMGNNLRKSSSKYEKLYNDVCYRQTRFGGSWTAAEEKKRKKNQKKTRPKTPDWDA